MALPHHDITVNENQEYSHLGKTRCPIGVLCIFDIFVTGGHEFNCGIITNLNLMLVLVDF